MKELYIFRIFAFFPFVGILLPDVANKLYFSITSFPPDHLIVEVTLLVCILICSGGIWRSEGTEAGAEREIVADL